MESYFLSGDRFDDIGSGDEHERGLFDHEDEVGDGGRVDGATGARTHDHGDLRNHARGQRVAKKNVSIP